MNVVNDLGKLEIYFKYGVENYKKKTAQKVIKRIINASKVSIKILAKV